MTESQQHLFARWILEQAQIMAGTTNEPEDRSAAVTAILAEALILSTPELTEEKRARLFLTFKDEHFLENEE